RASPLPENQPPIEGRRESASARLKIHEVKRCRDSVLQSLWAAREKPLQLRRVRSLAALLRELHSFLFPSALKALWIVSFASSPSSPSSPSSHLLPQTRTAVRVLA